MVDVLLIKVQQGKFVLHTLLNPADWQKLSGVAVPTRQAQKIHLIVLLSLSRYFGYSEGVLQQTNKI